MCGLMTSFPSDRSAGSAAVHATVARSRSACTTHVSARRFSPRTDDHRSIRVMGSGRIESRCDRFPGHRPGGRVCGASDSQQTRGLAGARGSGDRPRRSAQGAQGAHRVGLIGSRPGQAGQHPLDDRRLHADQTTEALAPTSARGCRSPASPHRTPRRRHPRQTVHRRRAHRPVSPRPRAGAIR